MGGGGGGQTQTSRTEIDSEFKPYITYALGEAQRLYQDMPEAPKTLAAPMSGTTTEALRLAEERALAGSPLLKAAQQEQFATIRGRETNPFLAGALQQANRLAGEEYTRNIQNLQSKAASAGRYGSASMGQQAGVNQDILARALAEQGGQLAYSSAEAERNRQMRAVEGAPAMSAADYADIEKLLRVGQGREGYVEKAIQGRLAAQDIPLQRLARAAQVTYGAPLETTSTSTATPSGGK
jgi:hypothetical protein